MVNLRSVSFLQTDSSPYYEMQLAFMARYEVRRKRTWWTGVWYDVVDLDNRREVVAKFRSEVSAIYHCKELNDGQ